MKKIIISVLSAALVFASCQKEAAPVSSGSSEVSFTATIPQTRTSFAPKEGNSYPVLWTGDEKVSVTYNFSTAKTAAVTASDDGSVATFAVEIAEDAEATAHNFYAVCPSSARVSASKDYQTLTVEFPSTQVPVDGSCDEAAQIIFAKHESTKFDNSVEFAFKHISAYGNLSLKLPSGVSEISSITLTAEKPLAGRFYYSPAEDTFEASAGSNSITLNTGKTSEVFFACVPVDLSGSVLKVVIAANGTTYTKNINLSGKTLKFEQGKVSKFSVDMSGVSADAKVVYNLVTDPTTLKVGDKVIIAASNANVALGTTQNANNRKAEAITKDGNTVVNPGDAVQILTLEKGTLDNTCAFNTGSGYLYAASSSSNNLKTQAEIDANASFRVSYADEVTTIKAKGANTRNLLKYNSSNSIFSCYASGQVDVVIYSDGKGTGAQLFSTAVDAPSTTPTYSSLAELVKAGEPTGGKVNVTLTNEEILSIYTTSKGGYRNGIFLQAGDREIEIYCQDVPADWVVGGTVSGTLKECTWENYNGTWELKPSSWSELDYTAPAGGGETVSSFNSTYSYGSLDGWSLSDYTDNDSYYLVPAKGIESVAVISGIFNGKTIASNVVITLNVATYGSGDNPTASTFSIYSNSDCTVSVTSAQSGTLPSSKTFTTVVYTVAKTDAAAFTNDLAIKVTCGEGSKQIRLKSINVKFSYK
ncbi:MAG: hypothetical protein PUH82_00170 [Bacteroidales bacterium]|nr:hypothetical protein [Bacteroidales bacterium]